MANKSWCHREETKETQVEIQVQVQEGREDKIETTLQEEERNVELVELDDRRQACQKDTQQEEENEQSNSTAKAIAWWCHILGFSTCSTSYIKIHSGHDAKAHAQTHGAQNKCLDNLGFGQTRRPF